MKWNILRRLSAHGCDVRVYPATTPASELLATKPDGVFLSNGPGDPAPLTYAIDNAKALVAVERAGVRDLPRSPDSRPGDGRQHVQAEVRPPRREPSGEEARNRQEWRSRRRTTASRSIPTSLPPDVEVTHLNLYDGTVEGLRHRDASGVLRAVPSRSVARSARRGLSLRRFPGVDRERDTRRGLRGSASADLRSSLKRLHATPP